MYIVFSYLFARLEIFDWMPDMVIFPLLATGYICILILFSFILRCSQLPYKLFNSCPFWTMRTSLSTKPSYCSHTCGLPTICQWKPIIQARKKCFHFCQILLFSEGVEVFLQSSVPTREYWRNETHEEDHCVWADACSNVCYDIYLQPRKWSIQILSPRKKILCLLIVKKSNYKKLKTPDHSKLYFYPRRPIHLCMPTPFTKGRQGKHMCINLPYNSWRVKISIICFNFRDIDIKY